MKAGMDSLPPGTKMFLNSGAYTNEESRYPPPLFTLTPRFYRNKQANSMGSIPQAQT